MPCFTMHSMQKTNIKIKPTRVSEVHKKNFFINLRQIFFYFKSRVLISFRIRKPSCSFVSTYQGEM